MKRNQTAMVAAALGLAFCAPGLATAAEEEGARSKQPETTRTEVETTSRSESARATEATRSSEVPIFVPPNHGAPKTRVGGATRRAVKAGLPEISALVPEEAGLTIEEQPVLYWHLSKETSSRVEVTVIDDSSVDPLLETTLEGPLEAGVRRIRLADHRLHLEPGVTYQWFVVLVPNPNRRSSYKIAGGGIERVDPSDELRAELAAAGATRVPFVLARAGIWYDALDALSRRIEASPGDVALRSQRAALFEQVGLHEVASAERSAARLDRE